MAPPGASGAAHALRPPHRRRGHGAWLRVHRRGHSNRYALGGVVDTEPGSVSAAGRLSMRCLMAIPMAPAAQRMVMTMAGQPLVPRYAWATRRKSAPVAATA